MFTGRKRPRKRLAVPFAKKSTTIMAYDLQAMHAGVIRDIEQQRIKKERQADFDMQRALEEEYRRVQQVHDGQGAGTGGEGDGG